MDRSNECSKLFSKDILASYRSNCLQLTSNQLDLVILAQLSACRTHKDCIPPSYRGKAETFRSHSSFSFHGISICRELFLFLHCISKQRLVTLCKHVDSHGISERIHGNSKRLPANTCPQSQIEHLVRFIDNCAEAHAMPLPGRMPNYRDDRVLLLPTDMTKARVYEMYQRSCHNTTEAAVGRAKFYRVWSAIRPYVATMKPGSDLCMDCQKLSESLSKSGYLTEEDKALRLKNYTDHLELAKKERTVYNEQISNCRTAYMSGVDNKADVPMHYSYDFAQQIHYPNNPLQPGPAYFLSARKCQMFGIACEPLGQQVNYLIDEADNVGKGANTTISLIHHYLEERTCTGATIYFHADNCIGQNKNNTTIQYLCWRVLTGKEQSITLSFLVSGHTKFAPDRHFGLIKKLYRKTRVDTMACIQNVVQKSSHIEANQVQLIRSLTGEQLVHFYDWSGFFQKFFTTIPAITSYHVFRIHHNSPGKVFIRKWTSTPEEEVDILKRTITPESFPNEIIPSGLNAQRQWYLYDKIRQFCSSNLSADLTCPKPVVVRPDHSINKRPPSVSQLSSTKKAPRK